MKQYLIYAVVFFVILLAGIWYVTAQGGQKAQKQSEEPAQIAQMSFFVTSVNPGKGADLGGLAGADTYCQSLAKAAGAGDRTWRAYLSATADDNSSTVNARDRIGNGPWENFNGVIIVNNLEELHGNNNLTKQTAMTEEDTATA